MLVYLVYISKDTVALNSFESGQVVLRKLEMLVTTDRCEQFVELFRNKMQELKAHHSKLCHFISVSIKHR